MKKGILAALVMKPKAGKESESTESDSDSKEGLKAALDELFDAAPEDRLEAFEALMDLYKEECSESEESE